MEQQQIEAYKEIGGNEWQEGDYHRIYFDDLPRWVGLSQNSTGFILDGYQISNAGASRIRGQLAGAKVYIDLNDGKFHGKGIDDTDFAIIVEAIKSAAQEAINA